MLLSSFEGFLCCSFVFRSKSLVHPAAANSLTGGGSLNGKSTTFQNRPARSVCVHVCGGAYVCVCVCGISYWKKNRVLRSHLMTPSLCTGAFNENQGCVLLLRRHIKLCTYLTQMADHLNTSARSRRGEKRGSY